MRSVLGTAHPAKHWQGVWGSFVNTRDSLTLNSPNVLGRWSVWRSPFSRVPFGAHAVYWGCAIILLRPDHGVWEAHRERKGRGRRRGQERMSYCKDDVSKLGSGTPIAHWLFFSIWNGGQASTGGKDHNIMSLQSEPKRLLFLSRKYTFCLSK